MKRNSIYMVLLFFISCFCIQAQQNDETKQSRKERKIEAYERKKRASLSLLNARDFVLQADRVNSPLSRMQNVSDKFNYLKVEGDSVFIQYAVNGLRGENGIGGDTYLGKISSWSTKDRGRGKPFITMIGFLTPSKGDFVSVYLTLKDGKAEARLIDNDRIITLKGDVINSVENADIKMLPNRSYH